MSNLDQGAGAMQALSLSITSEYEPLQAVLVHRPGHEIDRLTPENKADLLFEDIPYLDRMQEEHDRFVETMRKQGIEVIYLEGLVREVLEDRSVRQRLVMDATSLGAQPSLAGAILEEFSVEEISRLLFAGMTASEAQDQLHLELGPLDKKHDFFVLDPIPNAYFTRDPGVIIRNSLVSCKAHFRARMRETIILKTIFKSSGRFSPPCPVVYGDSLDEDRPYTIEGGDILVLNEDAIAVGCSQRTRSESIARLARKLFTSHQASRVYEVPIPAERTYMHLDTVLTIVDDGVVVSYPDVIDRIKGITLYEPLSIHGNEVIAFPSHDERPFKSILEEEFSRPLRVIPTGDNDPRFAAREQGADGTNMFAIAPGKVISYNRNTHTNRALERENIEVIPIEGSELVRGLGGPRCMTMPLRRLPRN